MNCPFCDRVMVDRGFVWVNSGLLPEIGNPSVVWASGEQARKDYFFLGREYDEYLSETDGSANIASLRRNQPWLWTQQIARLDRFPGRTARTQKRMSASD